MYVDTRQLISILATKLSNALLEKLRLYIFSALGVLCLQCPSYAQQLYQLDIIGDSKNILGFDLSQIPPQDSISISQTLKERIDNIKKEGYWLASLDDTKFEDQRALAKVFIGEKFSALSINKTNLGEKKAKDLSLHRLPKKFNLTQVSSLKTRVISLFQDIGFPFAQVRIDSFRLTNSELGSNLIIDTGSLISFDSLQLNDAEIVRPIFLARFLNIPYQEPFSQSEISNISRRVQHLPYLNLDEEPIVYFGLQKAKVNLSVSKRKTNSFDGIISLVPGTEERKSDVNGEFKLQLENLFKSGKSFGFHWKKITTQTQQLNVNYEHPYILGSPLELLLSFNQLKEGTLFSNRQLYLGFKHNLSVDSELSFFYENKSGNRLDETSIKNGDFNLNQYGAEFKLNKLDMPNLPKNGYLITATSSIGLKSISDNSLNGIEQKKSNQYQFSSSLSYYFSVKRNSVFHIKGSGGLLGNPRLFQNDLYRIGGLRSIRGFNENFFFATKYALANLEWHLYFEEASYLFLFFDQALIEEKTFIVNEFSQPSGLGIGLKIRSNSGFFNLAYGLGRVNDGFSFDQSKLHFGYTGNF